jgi:signal peptidase I
MTKHKPKESAFEFLRTFAYAVAIALVFRSFLFEPFHIPSGSMLSTLYEGDYIFVSKYAYGYSRYSFPFGASGLFDGFDGRIWESTPERGDVIVFRYPGDKRVDYIKRIVGLPGDRIQVTNGLLYINGRPVLLKQIEDFPNPDSGTIPPNMMKRYIETLPDADGKPGRQHLVLDERETDVDNTGEYVVPEGHYFFMGDNRDNSTDSRYLDAVGYVPAENLVGRAETIAFSANTDVPLRQFLTWIRSLRFERFFTWIE